MSLEIKENLFRTSTISTTLQIPANILGKSYWHELLVIARKKFQGQNSKLGFLSEINEVKPLGNPKVNQYEFTHASLHVDVKMDVMECDVVSGDKILGTVDEYIQAAQVAKIRNGPIVVISLVTDEFSDIKKGDVCELLLGESRQYNGEREIMFMADILKIRKGD